MSKYIKVDKKEKFIKKSQNKFKETDGSPMFDYTLVNYINVHTKIKIITKRYGIIEQTPASHLKGKGIFCQLGKTTQEFIDESNIIHNFFYIYDLVEYINGKTNVNIICPIHGIFEQKATCHLQGQGCKKCATEKFVNSHRLTLENFLEKLKNIHINDNGSLLYDYVDFNYIDTKTKGKIICKKHGEFWQTPNRHLAGNGCPKCSQLNKNETKLFNNIVKKFPNIKILQQGKLNWLKKPTRQRFDIYLPDYNIAIEYQGEQHFKAFKFFGGEKSFIRIKRADENKRILSAANNCVLFYFTYFKRYVPENYEHKIYHIEKELFQEIENIIIKKELEKIY